jgi:hypothetical protein
MAYPNNGGKPIFNEFITPIGLIVHASHDRPLLKTNEQTKKPIVDEHGLQEAEYRVTLAWEKQRIGELQALIQLARTTQEQAWPGSTAPGAFFALEPFFRDGDNPAHNTKKREYLFGKYYLNFKQKAIPSRNAQTGQVSYAGAPGLLGPYEEDIMPLDVYSGCTGRISGIMFGTEYMGRNFISTRLNNIQKFEDGERIGGGARPDPKSQFGALKTGGAGMRDVL